MTGKEKTTTDVAATPRILRDTMMAVIRSAGKVRRIAADGLNTALKGNRNLDEGGC